MECSINSYKFKTIALDEIEKILQQKELRVIEGEKMLISTAGLWI